MSADLSLLTRVAQELVTRVRDDDPDANAQWLSGVLQDPGDWFRLAFLLAAAVPDDRTWTELTSWFTGEEDRTEARRRQWREAQQRRRAVHRLGTTAVDGVGTTSERVEDDPPQGTVAA